MISIITPTHNIKWLNELKTTILGQTHEDWEWIILLNGGALRQKESLNDFDDERIKIYEEPGKNNKIGFLKKRACNLCSGDIIVEVDHDDLITEDCLEEVQKAFDDNPDIGFVYSDNAKLAKKFTPYNPEHGWQHSMFDWKGKELYRMHSLPITPGNLSFIWWCPDHVRAWRKDVYYAVGGHDENLEVGDDHDLMCRLYLETEFYHIDKVLYIYRIHDDKSNTWLENNKKVQAQTHANHNKYIYDLALKWSERNDLSAIDLCGGFDSPEGFESIDLDHGDIIHDLEHGIPLPSNSVGVVRAHDALEHIKDSIQLMHEIYRVLAPGGILLSFTPSTDGRGAFQDPTHVSFWNQNSFWYWTRKQQARYINNSESLFRTIKLVTVFPSKWHKDNDISYVIARLEKPVQVGVVSEPKKEEDNEPIRFQPTKKPAPPPSQMRREGSTKPVKVKEHEV